MGFISGVSGHGEQDCDPDFSPESPEMGEDLANVVTASAQDGKDRIADQALERATCQAAVGFHMPDFRLDGAAPPE